MNKMKRYLLACVLAVGLIWVVVCYAAGTSSINATVTVSGLGSGSMQLSKSFAGTVPTVATRAYRRLDSNDVNETVDVGDVNVIEGMMIGHVDDSCDTTTGDLLVDCNSSSSVAFSADITLAEGEITYFKPLGDVEVIGANDVETPIYEYIVYGTRE